MSAHDDGRAAHAAGTELTANPHTEGSTDFTDWAAGWTDAVAEASVVTEEQPAAPEGGDAGAAATEVVASLGDAGFDRIMELLENPPLDDLPAGSGDSLPPNGDVPTDLGDWLEAWKQPLAFVAVSTAINAVKSRVGGAQASRGRLKELYRGMSPDGVTAAMQANADTIAKFADQRVAEAGMISSLQAKVTQKAAGYLLSALLLV